MSHQSDRKARFGLYYFRQNVAGILLNFVKTSLLNRSIRRFLHSCGMQAFVGMTTIDQRHSFLPVVETGQAAA